MREASYSKWMQDHRVEDEGVSGAFCFDVCAVCGSPIEGRRYQCGKGVVCEHCLDEIKEPKNLLAYIRDNAEDVVEFLLEHMSDDFLDEFWSAFRDDYEIEIERWATS